MLPQKIGKSMPVKFLDTPEYNMRLLIFYLKVESFLFSSEGAVIFFSSLLILSLKGELFLLHSEDRPML